jgi:excisionase family DNA binding protein
MFSQRLRSKEVKMEDVLYTVDEVSKLLKTNPATVYELIKAGTLPVLKLGRYKVRRVALLQFLKKFEGKDITDPYNVKELKNNKSYSLEVNH